MRTRLLHSFIKHTLGYSAEKYVSFFSLLDRALLKHNIVPIGTIEEKEKIVIELCKSLGIISVKNNKKKKRSNNTSQEIRSVSSNDFLKSYEWRKLRMEALKKYGAKCQCCGATPNDNVRMNVDHIKPRKIYPELALDINNLQILCEECNHGKGNWDQTDWRKSI